MQERNVDVGDVDIDQIIWSHQQIIVKKYQYKKKKTKIQRQYWTTTYYASSAFDLCSFL